MQRLIASVYFFLSVPGVSGSSVTAGNGSGSILLNFDNEEQTRPSSAGQQQQRLQPLPQQQQQQQQQLQQQQQHGTSHAAFQQVHNQPQLVMSYCCIRYPNRQIS